MTHASLPQLVTTVSCVARQTAPFVRPAWLSMMAAQPARKRQSTKDTFHISLLQPDRYESRIDRKGNPLDCIGDAVVNPLYLHERAMPINASSRNAIDCV